MIFKNSILKSETSFNTYTKPLNSELTSLHTALQYFKTLISCFETLGQWLIAFHQRSGFGKQF
jgi:hypothetical protein